CRRRASSFALPETAQPREDTDAPLEEVSHGFAFAEGVAGVCGPYTLWAVHGVRFHDLRMVTVAAPVVPTVLTEHHGVLPPGQTTQRVTHGSGLMHSLLL